VDEAEGAGVLRQRSRRRPDDLEGPPEQRCVIGRNKRLDELEGAIGVPRRRVIAVACDRR